MNKGHKIALLALLSGGGAATSYASDSFYCFYKYSNTESVNYLYMTEEAEGEWLTVQNSEVTPQNKLRAGGYALKLSDDDAAKKLLNTCRNQITMKIGESARFVELRASYYSRLNLSYLSKPGYPVVFEHPLTSDLTRLDSLSYQDLFQAVDPLSMSVFSDRDINTPSGYRKQLVKGTKQAFITAKETIKESVATCAANKAAAVAGEKAALKFKRFLYEDPERNIRNVWDNEISNEYYVAFKRPKAVSSFLNLIGIDLDAIFGISGPLKPVFNPIRQKIEDAVADQMSSWVNQGVEKSVGYLAKKGVYMVLGFSENKINAMLFEEKAAVEENLVVNDQRDVAINSEELHSLVSDALAQAAGIESYESNTNNKLSKSDIFDPMTIADSFSGLGGVEKLRKMRGGVVAIDESSLITPAAIVRRNLSEIKIAVYETIYELVIEGVNKGLEAFAMELTNKGYGAMTFGSIAGVMIGGPAALIPASITVADMVSGGSVKEAIATTMAGYMKTYNTRYLKNSDIPLPSFLIPGKEDVQRVYGGEKISVEDMGSFIMMGDFASGNRKVPTVSNFLIQEAERTKALLNRVKDNVVYVPKKVVEMSGNVMNKATKAANFLFQNAMSWFTVFNPDYESELSNSSFLSTSYSSEDSDIYYDIESDYDDKFSEYF